MRKPKKDASHAEDQRFRAEVQDKCLGEGTQDAILEGLCASIPVKSNGQHSECQHGLSYQKHAVKVFRKHVSHSADKR
jgi:hypothetical protein